MIISISIFFFIFPFKASFWELTQNNANDFTPFGFTQKRQLQIAIRGGEQHFHINMRDTCSNPTISNQAHQESTTF
jgi:hypothetical protein